MAGKNGMNKVKRGVHAHERNMHPGKPLTKINGNGKNSNGKNMPRGRGNNR